jgi:pyruvate dehydrogenase E2 component (dihydrolipoamide acetyltransferase)
MEVIMPQFGETVTEGTISTWLKSVGDRIEPGDGLFEVESDKVSMEVPAIAAGVLSEIRVAVGETAAVGVIVAIILEAASEAAPAVTGAAKPVAATPASPAAPKAAPAATTPAAVAVASAPAPQASVTTLRTVVPPRVLNPFEEVFSPIRNYGGARLSSGVAVTPYARRLAAERKLNLADVRGSGPDGRVVGRDVLSFKPGDTGDSQVKQQYDSQRYVEIPVDTMRSAIARRLTESKQTIPHFQLTVEVEIDRLLKRRESFNAASLADVGDARRKISLNDLVIEGWAVALARTPDANAVWAGDKILKFSQVDIAVAVSVGNGLFTPVLRDLVGKSATEIGRMTRDVIERSRSRKLTASDWRGGVSTISNLSMFGIREFAAIINPPQSTILAVGAAERRAFEAPGGGVRFATCMSFTLGCDHRLVDGVLGAQLLGAFRDWATQAA